jgi:CheY-like chemotaxis protein
VKPHLALVVDDSMLIRHLLGRFLEKRGFSVQSVSDGAEALKLMESVRPQVIFTDLQMPRLDGHRFIEILDNSPDLSRIPLVVLSAAPGPAAQDEPDRARFVIAKNLNIERQLRHILERLQPLLERDQRNTSDASAENSATAKSCASHLG